MPLTVSASAGTAERHPVDPCPMGGGKKKKREPGGNQNIAVGQIRRVNAILGSSRRQVSRFLRVASHRFARELRAHRGIQERAVFGSKYGEALAAGYLHGGCVHVTGVAM